MNYKSYLVPGDMRIKGSSRMNRSGPAIFIDLDGTLWPDLGPGTILENQSLVQYDIQILQMFSDLGYLLIGITNQTLFGYESKIKLSKVLKYRRRLRNIVEIFSFDSLFVCHHHPNSQISFLRSSCPNRKPGIGSIQWAIDTHNIDISKSFILGDRITDMLAGQAAGIPHRLLIVNSRSLEWNEGKHFSNIQSIGFRTYRNLREALKSIQLVIGA